MIAVTGSRRALVLLCLCCGFWAFGFGLECPLSSRWLQDAGHSSTLIGLNTSTHFLGVLLAGPIAPLIMRRSMRGCIAAGLLLCGLGIAAFPWAGAPAGWFSCRLLAGAGGALTMVGLETMINLNAPEARRAGHFAWYACSVGIGFALGSSVGLHVFGFNANAGFVLGGAVTLLAVPLLPLLPSMWRPVEHAQAAGPLNAPFLSFASAWAQGFLEAGMLALLPLYLRSVGLDDGQSGTLIGGVLMGVLICQVPIGCLADRCGRERSLIACMLALVVALLVTPQAATAGWLPVCLVIAGACSGALYPLGLALLGERVPAQRLPQANARFVAANCVGSLVCPLVSGPAMEYFGPPAMFWTPGALIACILIACAFGRLHGRGRPVFQLGRFLSRRRSDPTTRSP